VARGASASYDNRRARRWQRRGTLCALRAAETRPRRVALIEKDKVGGTCLHRGCIPTKGAAARPPRSRTHARDSASVGRQDHLRGDRRPGCAFLQGRRGRPALEGACSPPSRAGKIDTIEGSGAAGIAAQRPGRRYHLRGRAHRARQRIAAAEPARSGDRRRTRDHLGPGAGAGPSPPLRWSSSAGGRDRSRVSPSVWRSFGAEVTIVELLPQLLPLEDETSAKLLQRAFPAPAAIRFELGAGFLSRSSTRTTGRHGHARGRQDARRPTLMLVAVGRGPVSDGLGYEEAGRGHGGGVSSKVDSLWPDEHPLDLRGR